MKYYILALPFLNDGVLLTESGRFPGKLNGIGGPVNIYAPGGTHLPNMVDHYMKTEIGVNTSGLEKRSVVVYNGPGFMVFVYRIDIPNDDSLINIDDCENPDRGWAHILVDEIFDYRDQFAPNLSVLVTLADENPTTPFLFTDPR